MKNEANALLSGKEKLTTAATCRQCFGSIHRIGAVRRCGKCGLEEKGYYRSPGQAFDIIGQPLKVPGPKSPMVYGPGCKPKAEPQPTAVKPAPAGRSK